MSVYRVLDKLEAYVREGTWLPAGYRILSEERLSEFIEKMRATLPEEVGRAKIITKDHERMLRAAQEKAQALVDDAATKHEEMVDQHEVVQRARRTAEAVLRDAQERAQRVREGADHYAASVLGEMESRLSGALGAVRKGRDALSSETTTGTTSAPQLADAAAKSKRAAFDQEHAPADVETATLEAVES
ncbi:MAG: ATP synthase subunit B family protein [Candidatus Tyrphobacter sp.]